MLPADLARLAAAHRARAQYLFGRVRAEVIRAWGQMQAGDPAGSWQMVGPRLVTLITQAQAEAARGAQDYIAAAMSMQGASSDPAGTVPASAFAGTSSSGMPLDVLLSKPVDQLGAFIGAGMPADAALAVGLRHMQRIVSWEIPDAARVATGVAIVNERHSRGWIRMTTPPSCSRCIVLAGKFYRYNQGFLRHPHCDCVHVPSAEVITPESPRKLFDSLSAKEQDRLFTNAGARAIRDGADVGQVVNARRGALGLSPAGARITEEERRLLIGGGTRGRLQTTNVYGRQVYITTEGVTTRGLAGVRLGARTSGVKTSGARYRSSRGVRLMPESIYAEAERLGWSRDELIRQLTRFGYIV